MKLEAFFENLSKKLTECSQIDAEFGFHENFVNHIFFSPVDSTLKMGEFMLRTLYQNEMVFAEVSKDQNF